MHRELSRVSYFLYTTTILLAIAAVAYALAVFSKHGHYGWWIYWYFFQYYFYFFYIFVAALSIFPLLFIGTGLFYRNTNPKESSELAHLVVSPRWFLNIPVLNSTPKYRAIHLSGRLSLRDMNSGQKIRFIRELKKEIERSVYHLISIDVQKIVMSSHLLASGHLAKSLLDGLEDGLPEGWAIKFEKRKTPVIEAKLMRYCYFYMHGYLPTVHQEGGRIIVEKI